MPRGKGIYDEEKAVEPKVPPDQGGDDEGDTPDVAETDQEPTG
jgi:hypothetical protein